MILDGCSGTKYDLHRDPFASGGEGELYWASDRGIRNSAELVAKIFKDNVDINEKEKKIMAMLKNRPYDPQQELAWPIDGLYLNGRFVGYVMVKAESSEVLSALYEYGDFSKFSDTPLSKKIQVAMNICSALNKVHEAGHVCGDLNPNNVSVNSQTGRITLLDTDSYHINDGSDLYRCKVGMPDYIAPELQGKLKDGLDRAQLPTFTGDTDRFALAIHIFQLLMNGVHPFSCASTTSNVPPLADNIASKRFIFHNTNSMYFPPVMAPGFHSLPSSIRELFIRSFLNPDPRRRTTPVEWYMELDSFKNDLKGCNAVKSHQFYNKLMSCPLCEADNRFNAVRASSNQTGSTNILLQPQTWSTHGQIPVQNTAPAYQWQTVTHTPGAVISQPQAWNTHGQTTTQNTAPAYQWQTVTHTPGAAVAQPRGGWQPKLHNEEAFVMWILAFSTIIPGTIHYLIGNETDPSMFYFYLFGIIMFVPLLLFGSLNGRLAQILTATAFILSPVYFSMSSSVIWVYAGSFLLLICLSNWRSNDSPLDHIWAIGLSTGFIAVPIDAILGMGYYSFFYAIGFITMILLSEFHLQIKNGIIFTLNLLSGLIMLSLATLEPVALIPFIANAMICIMYIYYKRYKNQGSRS